MRSAVVAICLTGCHVISQLDNTRPGPERLAHHLDHPSPQRPKIVVGDAGAIRFIEPLVCPTERTTDTLNSTEVITGPNIATFVVGMIATSIGAIALAKGSFDHDAAFIVGGASGLVVGLPLTIGPWLNDTRELRTAPPGVAITTEGPDEPCGERPLAAKTASIAVHGLELEGTIDERGVYSISPFSVIDAYEIEKVPPWDAVITIDHGQSFTQLINGGDFAVHALEFIKHLDVDGTIAPMRLVPSIAPAPLRVSLTSNAGGPVLRVVMSLGNDGPGDASAVRGQITAQSSLIDGRMIYVGGIRKGDTVTRELLLPITPGLAATLRDDPLDLSIELRDGHGTAPTAPVRFRGVVLAEAPR